MEKDKRFNLYKQGLSDKQIAKRLGLSATGVNKWRKRHNLPSNHPEYHRPGGDTPFVAPACMLTGTAVLVYRWKNAPG